MIIQPFAFYLFSLILVLSASLVVSSKNPVHSVLFLILAFFNAAGLFVLLGAEFIAMIIVVVYVGAVAVLFMFVVMMLDINFVELRQGFLRYLPIGAFVGAVLLVELIVIMGQWEMPLKVVSQTGVRMPDNQEIGNTYVLGELLYTHYIYLFQAGGLILLIAMIGAIVLTHRRREGVRKQVIAHQLARKPEIELVKMPARDKQEDEQT